MDKNKFIYGVVHKVISIMIRIRRLNSASRAFTKYGVFVVWLGCRPISATLYRFHSEALVVALHPYL